MSLAMLEEAQNSQKSCLSFPAFLSLADISLANRVLGLHKDCVFSQIWCIFCHIMLAYSVLSRLGRGIENSNPQ
jgi:hypothetical protein